MLYVLIFMLSFVALLLTTAKARADVHAKETLLAIEKPGLGGGRGTIRGAFAFTRDMPPKDHAVKEIAWLTISPGDSIGVHKHENNEEVYVVTAGNGIFTDVDGRDYALNPGDITICRRGQTHGIRNEGTKDLVMLTVIAEQ